MRGCHAGPFRRESRDFRCADGRVRKRCSSLALIGAMQGRFARARMLAVPSRGVSVSPPVCRATSLLRLGLRLLCVRIAMLRCWFCVELMLENAAFLRADRLCRPCETGSADEAPEFSETTRCAYRGTWFGERGRMGTLRGGRDMRKTKIIGVLCGLVCALCVFAYTASVRDQAERERADALSRFGGEQVEVCVATRDIAPGETVSASAVETKLWVADLLPADAVRVSADIVGKRAASSILEGEVLSARRFEDRSALVDVPEGLVALSVPADEVQAVGGAIVPGEKVDIYATGNTTTQRVGTSVPVLATSASVGGENATAEVSWITLAVAPESVQELVSVAQKSQLYFALPAQVRLADDEEEKQ